MLRHCCIYAWFTEGKIYIGKSHEANPNIRFRGHIKSANVDKPKAYAHRFLKRILGQGVHPRIVVLEYVDLELPEIFDLRRLRSYSAEQLDPKERWWIRYFRQRSPLKVLNGSDGGDGGYPPDDNTRQRISLKLTGRKFSDETIVRMREAQQRRCANPEESIRRSEKLKAFYQTAEGQRLAEESSKRNTGVPNVRKGTKGPPVGDDTRAKLGKKSKEWWNDPTNEEAIDALCELRRRKVKEYWARVKSGEIIRRPQTVHNKSKKRLPDGSYG